MFLARRLSRSFASGATGQFRVAVLGASGGIGQPLALLLKSSPHVKELGLYDVASVTPGVAADLSHICTPAKVTSGELASVLQGSDVVVVPAGVPRKPGMSRDDLFNTNASIVHTLATAVAKHCPRAHLLIISNPVNSTVPICAEALAKAGVYDPARLFGVTTLDVTRARTFIGEARNVSPLDVHVPVVGGHAGKTILPLLSQATASGRSTAFADSDEEVAALTHRIQFGGDEVVKAKAGAGSATLSMAYAGAAFAQRLMAAMAGEQGVVECAYVEQAKGAEGPRFFACPVTLGPNGVEAIHRDLGKLSAFEKNAYDEMVPELESSIEKGIAFVQNAK